MLPDRINEEHLQLMINMLRELDSLSTGSLNGLDYGTIQKVLSEVSPLDIARTPRQASVDKASMFIINIIYNMARGDIEEDAAVMIRACRLTMIGKKDGGQRPISVGQVYRRLAGRFIVQVYKKEVIEAMGLTKRRRSRMERRKRRWRSKLTWNCTRGLSQWLWTRKMHLILLIGN